MNKKTRITVAGVASAAMFSAGAATAYAAGHNRFGHSPIRDGVPRAAAHFHVSSPDLRDGGAFPAADVCTGATTPPRLTWSGAPAGTKSFAVEMFDPDAPTGSGFSHWRAWDIPATASTFGGQAAVPAGTVVGQNDFGDPRFDGPCPPTGDIVHRYQIRVLALDVPSIGLPSAGTSTAYSGFVMGGHIVGVARMTVSAQE
ncbi:YbhB/YbcL family Raf kinase inhibitor-like protein [Catenulispora sp. NF23]|uniref:YbhB/YbcL family Raf kinase inhibitor-like protein n=1 Tax=Catenulispora pinistramenti TaxID=2705254 RepID=UPI001BA4A1E4|nr:YbhB/YbcL family Raf kinase inhibitor-like protein [Catenulispora pinistramenti]MBS2536292.1 YbhB/YbcL family Raf kinase inhibitor-like protein [Catenulispora pinistramenti]